MKRCEENNLLCGVDKETLLEFLDLTVDPILPLIGYMTYKGNFIFAVFTYFLKKKL